MTGSPNPASSTADHVVGVDQSCFIYRLWFEEVTKREGELSTEFEKIKNIGLMSVNKLDEVSW